MSRSDVLMITGMGGDAGRLAAYERPIEPELVLLPVSSWGSWTGLQGSDKSGTPTGVPSGIADSGPDSGLTSRHETGGTPDPGRAEHRRPGEMASTASAISMRRTRTAFSPCEGAFARGVPAAEVDADCCAS